MLKIGVAIGLIGLMVTFAMVYLLHQLGVIGG
jgi:hypothetical protein